MNDLMLLDTHTKKKYKYLIKNKQYHSYMSILIHDKTKIINIKSCRLYN